MCIDNLLVFCAIYMKLSVHKGRHFVLFEVILFGGNDAVPVVFEKFVKHSHNHEACEIPDEAQSRDRDD